MTVFTKTLAAMAATTMLCGAAFAGDTVVLGAGADGNGYDRAMDKLAVMLTNQGVETSVNNMEGSEEIVTALCTGTADFAPAQIDAYRNGDCALTPVGVYGTEVVHILFPPNSDKEELHDLGEGDKVLVGNFGSGSALTFETMRGIETGEHGNNSDWAGARPEYGSYDNAAGMAAAGTISAVFMVANPDAAAVDVLISQGWQPGEVVDKDLNDLMFNNAPLYARTKVKYSTSRWGYDTYEVKTLYLASGNFQTEHPDAAKITNRVWSGLN